MEKQVTTIEKIKIQNYKGIKSYDGEVFGRDIYVTGRNEAGKTSFIDAVFMALTGKNIPPKPVTTGAKKGLIEIKLADGYIVRIKMNSTGKTPVSLEIENLNATNEKEKIVSAPRTWLNSRIGILDFDVNDFFKKSDAEQVKYFAKIQNFDTSEIDEQIEELEESRKFDKKSLTLLKTQTGFYKDEDLEKELIDVVQLSKDIAALKETERIKAEDYQKVTDGVADREASVKELKRMQEEIKAKLEGGSYISVSGLTIVVESGLEQQIEGGYQWLENPDHKPVPNVKLQEMEAELENSEQINIDLGEYKKFALVDKQIEKLETAITEASEGIEEQKALKAKLIAEKISIEGLTYDTENERFLFNGLPFDKNQINTASQIIAGLKIGASLLNEIKILRVDASLIDKENFAKVQEWSKSEGIELFVELVDRESGELKIQIDEVV